MNKDNFDKKYSNNENILLEISNELTQLKNYSKDNLIIKTLDTSIMKINYIINENKKNLESIKNDISSLYKTIEALKSNNNNKTLENKELKFDEGKYIGQVENNLQEGTGTFYYTSGSIYKGEWKKGKKEGKGNFYCNKEPFNGDRYEGNWKNDKQDGKGTYFFKDGDIYDGNWKNGRQEGKGIYDYNDGDRYEGDFKSGVMDGKGIYYYSNGERYEGDFRKGKREGRGIYYYNNGERKMGDYLNDHPTGVHVLVKRNGVIMVENY